MPNNNQSKFKPVSKEYKEIITKSVCGKAEKIFLIEELIYLPGDQNLTRVLGSTVTRLKIGQSGLNEAAASQKPGINISVAFKVHVWYAYNDGKATGLIKKNVYFNEVLPVKAAHNEVINPVDVRLQIFQTPECLDALIIEGNQIRVNVQLGIRAEIIGETRILVCTYKPAAVND